MEYATHQDSDNRWWPVVNGNVVKPPLSDGFVYEKFALNLAKTYAELGIDKAATVEKFKFPEGTPMVRTMPDPQKPRTGFEIVAEGDNPAMPRVTEFTLVDVNPSAIEYETPDVFDMSTSKGTTPLICCTMLQPQTEADVVPIEKVRLMNARASVKPDRVDVNLSPYDEGMNAAINGKGIKSCPYPKADASNHNEWMDGFFFDE